MAVKTFLAVTVAVVVAAVIIGLVLAGGPGLARRDRIDVTRLKDLNAIGEALHCPGHANANLALPTELSIESLKSHCPSVKIAPEQLTDRMTGEPYAYVRSSNRAFSVCATFFDAARIGEKPRSATGLRANYFRFVFDPDTGCLSGQIWEWP